MTAFVDSLEHLLAELERVDLRVRAQVAAVRGAARADDAFRGLYLSEAQVDALLDRPQGEPAWPRLPARACARSQALREHNAQRARDAAARGIDLRLQRLQLAFGLDDDALDVLLLCLAVELDGRYEKLYAYLQDDVARKRPGIELLLQLLAPSLAERLRLQRLFAPHAPLFRLGLLEMDAGEPGAAPRSLGSRTVRTSERVLQFLLGDDTVATDLQACLRLDDTMPALDEIVVDAAATAGLRRVADEARAGRTLVVHLRGPQGVGKQEAAGAVARALGRPLLVLDLPRVLEAQGPGIERLWPAIAREAVLQRAPLYCTGFDLLADEARRGSLEAFADRLLAFPWLVLLGGQRAWEPGGRWRAMRHASLELPALQPRQRETLWRRELPGALEGEGGVDLPELAAKFRLGAVPLRDAAASLRRWRAWQGHAEGAVPATLIHEACRAHSNQQLSTVAVKITPKYRWDDIVLPADRLEVLREICSHVKYRGKVYGDWGFGGKLAMGKGLAVLFAGPSGTGKTMAADVMAGELGLDLYKIDLASVISKYIGETERNLGRIFDEAQTSNAILFFDEADALFGKRSEVRDSHDRYANIEVGYLLQRLESYEGVAILATNFRKNMDEAFVRRLHFTVEFPFPGVEERRRIWTGIWPRDMPRAAGLDPDDLGRRFEMTGGNIRNVALAAAFLAATDGAEVQLDHVLRATRREYQKMGKLIEDASLRPAARAQESLPSPSAARGQEIAMSMNAHGARSAA
jgi:AAA+ superfamily predicted ATPase